MHKRYDTIRAFINNNQLENNKNKVKIKHILQIHHNNIIIAFTPLIYFELSSHVAQQNFISCAFPQEATTNSKDI